MRDTKWLKNGQTSQGYIIRILQQFATKLWNITNFVMLFQAVMKFLSRLVEIKILVIRLKIHCEHKKNPTTDKNQKAVILRL
jgi:hypothetical protein